MPLINRCGGGGGTPQLCGQVENFKVIPGTTALTAVLSWTAPSPDEDNSFVGARIVRKTGSAPTGINDGTVVYEGTALTYTDTGLTAGTTYYYRAFAYNARTKYQTAKRTVSLTALAVGVDLVFGNNSWSAIRYVSDLGGAQNFWSVGDRKQITINGTINDATFSAEQGNAFILGFNHNANIEGANRIHLCIAGEQYTPSDGQATYKAWVKGYNSAGKPFYINASQHNAGGWGSSDMRTKILGTSITSYTGTFLGALPADLRTELKSITKYTDNTGGACTEAASVTATTDYMFLLSPYEIAAVKNVNSFNGAVKVNPYEYEKQEQYAYFAAGNSKSFYYMSSGSSSIARLWSRSPDGTKSSVGGGYHQFCDTSGTGFLCNYSRGIIPCVCI